MPKNKGKGGKKFRKSKKDQDFSVKRPLILKEDGQEYAQVLKMCGDGRCKCFCFDGKERMCIIRGNMRRKVWIMADNIVLVSIRDFQDDKADIILKYSDDDAKQLRRKGFIADNIKSGGVLQEVEVEKNEDMFDDIEFDNDLGEDDIDNL